MWRLLGYVLAGLFAAGRDNDIQEAIIDTVNRNARKVKLKDIKRDRYLEVEGDEIASDVHEGDHIYA